MLKGDAVLFAIAIDDQLKRGRERVDHRYTNTVQSAGYLVGVVVKLAAGMELGHDHLSRRHAFFMVQVSGDAAAIIGDRDRAIAVQDHLDQITMPGQRLINGVVHHLIDHVMQTGAIIGITDIHAWPFSYCF